MKVVSKLVDLELHIGHIEKNGDLLLVYSDPKRSMPTTIHIDAQDVFSIIKVLISSVGFWKFLISIPWLLIGFEKKQRKSSKIGTKTNDPTTDKKWDPWE